MPEIETEFLFEARVKLAEPQNIGPTPEGFRMIVPVAGGRFEGPRLAGEVVPFSGADWARIRPDGSGALIHVHWHGIMHFAPEDQAYAMDFAKDDDPAGASRYYFRASPRFEVGDPRYEWLNTLICITKSRTGDGGVIHRMFAVK